MPIELELSEILANPNQEYLSDGSLVILVHPRDRELMTRTIVYLKGTRREITLSAHYQTEDQKIEIRKAFGRYWYRFKRVIWNNVSPAGHRTAVRFHNLEAAKILFSTWVIFLDSDLDNRSVFFGRKNSPKKRHFIAAHEWISRLMSAMIHHKWKGRIFFGVLDSHKWLDYIKLPYGKRMADTPSNLSGVWPIWLDALRTYNPEYNPWERGMKADMHYADDIVASHELSERGIYLRLNYLSWDGNRDCYYNPHQKYVRDALACLLLTSPNRMMISQQKRWKTGPGGGQLVDLRMAAEGVTLDVNDPNPAKTIDGHFNRIAEEHPHIIGIGEMYANADL